MPERLDFVVVGAQKAGTTTLHEWLTQDARISLPVRKETHFFSSDARYSRGWDWYWSCFPVGDYDVTGEVDPNYLSSPDARRALRAAFGRELKIVIVARNPIDRARSQFGMSVRRGLEDRSFEKALEDELAVELGEGPDWCDYIWRSLYGLHVSAWMDDFDHVRVVKYEDLFDPTHGPAHYESLLDFIGLPMSSQPPDMSLVANSQAASKSSLVSRLIWDKSFAPKARRGVKALVPSANLRYRLGRTVDRWNRRQVDQSQPHGISGLAADLLREDAGLLARQSGLSVVDWTHRP